MAIAQCMLRLSQMWGMWPAIREGTWTHISDHTFSLVWWTGSSHVPFCPLWLQISAALAGCLYRWFVGLIASVLSIICRSHCQYLYRWFVGKDDIAVNMHLAGVSWLFFSCLGIDMALDGTIFSIDDLSINSPVTMRFHFLSMEILVTSPFVLDVRAWLWPIHHLMLVCPSSTVFQT